ncbi:immunity 41 family protein [Bibersteinia trehalosi]|uniref:immunity 41 family protein n=1 Tax=Bibersteinia trehalosi TaxID=47735 RepID=UPI002D782FD4|nr:immunity 41 family protein [Bibersteinia trehalosi]
MEKYMDFYRNVTYSRLYDENSFIGRWLDYSEWNDDEYWKLEKDFLNIAITYRKTKLVEQDVLIGIMRIIELLIIPSWDSFTIFTDGKSDIYDRYERFKYIISKMFADEHMDLSIFSYNPNSL